MKIKNSNCGISSFQFEDIYNPVLSPEKQKIDFQVIRKVIEEVMPDLHLRFSHERVKQLMDSMQNTFTEPLSVIDYYRKTAPFLDQFACSHTKYDMRQELIDSIIYCGSFFSYPLYYTHDELFVNTYSLDNETGGKVLMIDGESIHNWFSKCDDYIYSDVSVPAQRYFLGTQMNLKNYLINRNKKNTISLQVYTDRVIKIERNYSSSPPYFIDNGIISVFSRQNDCIINDSSGIARLIVNNFQPENTISTPFSNFLINSMELIRLKKIKQLVLDLRDNPGGLDHHELELRSFFSTDKLSAVKSQKVRTLTYPCDSIANQTFQNTNLSVINTNLKSFFKPSENWGYDCIQESIYSIKPQKMQYDGEILILINEGTNSAALRLAYFLRSYCNCKIAGQSPASRATYSNAGYLIKYKLKYSKITLTVPLYYRENWGDPAHTLSNGQLKIDYPIKFTRENFVNRIDPYEVFVNSYYK